MMMTSQSFIGTPPGTAASLGTSVRRSHCIHGTLREARCRRSIRATADGSCRGSSGAGRTTFSRARGRSRRPRKPGTGRNARTAGRAQWPRAGRCAAAGRARSGSLPSLPCSLDPLAMGNYYVSLEMKAAAMRVAAVEAGRLAALRAWHRGRPMLRPGKFSAMEPAYAYPPASSGDHVVRDRDAQGGDVPGALESWQVRKRRHSSSKWRIAMMQIHAPSRATPPYEEPGANIHIAVKVNHAHSNVCHVTDPTRTPRPRRSAGWRSAPRRRRAARPAPGSRADRPN